MTDQTVLVTGASGYIAKHVVRTLLDAGYTVVGSVRSPARGDEIRAAVAPHLASADNLDERLRFVTLDLTSDTGWAEAMQGIDALIHTASPFPLEQPKDDDDLVRPAEEAGAWDTILTSADLPYVGACFGADEDEIAEAVLHYDATQTAPAARRASLVLGRNWLRLVTGMGTGLAMGLLVFPALMQTLWRNGNGRSIIENGRELLAMLLLAGTAVLLVLSNQPTILYVMALVSVAGVLMIVTSLNAVLLLMLFKRDGRAVRWQETAVPLLISLTLAVLELGSIAILRLNFTGTITGFPGLA